MNVNTWHGCGNLTRDPEVRTAGESSVCKFSIAINRTWKDKTGQKKEEVTFVDCEAWGRTAEVIGQYSTKGSEIYVQGRLKLDTWEDQTTKEKRSKLKVVVEVAQLGRKKDGGGGAADDGDGEDAAIAGARRAAGRAQAPARSAAPARPAAGGADDEPPFHRFASADTWG